MRQVIRLNEEIRELQNDRRNIIGDFINKELGTICSLLHKLGFKNESYREDTRSFTIKVNHIEGLRANTFRIEYDYNSNDFRIYMTKRKSYKSFNQSGKFCMHHEWTVTEDNHEEMVADILEHMKYEYEDLFRKHKLERISK